MEDKYDKSKNKLVRCVVPNCNKKYTRGPHCFQISQEHKLLWLYKIRNDESWVNCKMKNKQYICSNHFLAQDLKKGYKNIPLDVLPSLSLGDKVDETVNEKVEIATPTIKHMTVDLFPMCCTCLQNSKGVDIFQKWDENSESSCFISDIVMEISGIKITKNNLVTTICMKCLNNLRKAYEFRIQCRISNETLTRNLKPTSVDVEIIDVDSYAPKMCMQNENMSLELKNEIAKQITNIVHTVIFPKLGKHGDDLLKNMSALEIFKALSSCQKSQIKKSNICTQTVTPRINPISCDPELESNNETDNESIIIISDILDNENSNTNDNSEILNCGHKNNSDSISRNVRNDNNIAASSKQNIGNFGIIYPRAARNSNYNIRDNSTSIINHNNNKSIESALPKQSVQIVSNAKISLPDQSNNKVDGTISSIDKLSHYIQNTDKSGLNVHKGGPNIASRSSAMQNVKIIPNSMISLQDQTNSTIEKNINNDKKSTQNTSKNSLNVHKGNTNVQNGRLSVMKQGIQILPNFVIALQGQINNKTNNNVDKPLHNIQNTEKNAVDVHKGDTNLQNGGCKRNLDNTETSTSSSSAKIARVQKSSSNQKGPLPQLLQLQSKKTITQESNKQIQKQCATHNTAMNNIVSTQSSSTQPNLKKNMGVPNNNMSMMQPTIIYQSPDMSNPVVNNTVVNNFVPYTTYNTPMENQFQAGSVGTYALNTNTIPTQCYNNESYIVYQPNNGIQNITYMLPNCTLVPVAAQANNPPMQQTINDSQINNNELLINKIGNSAFEPQLISNSKTPTISRAQLQSTSVPNKIYVQSTMSNMTSQLNCTKSNTQNTTMSNRAYIQTANMVNRALSQQPVKPNTYTQCTLPNKVPPDVTPSSDMVNKVLLQVGRPGSNMADFEDYLSQNFIPVEDTNTQKLDRPNQGTPRILKVQSMAMENHADPKIKVRHISELL